MPFIKKIHVRSEGEKIARQNQWIHNAIWILLLSSFGKFEIDAPGKQFAFVCELLFSFFGNVCCRIVTFSVSVWYDLSRKQPISFICICYGLVLASVLYPQLSCSVYCRSDFMLSHILAQYDYYYYLMHLYLVSFGLCVCIVLSVRRHETLIFIAL